MAQLTIDNILQIGTIIISTAGFVMLYSTFTLQAQTFKSQLEMSKLDYQRFLLQIRPSFTKNTKISKYSAQKYQGKEDVEYFLILEKNPLKELYLINLGKTLNEFIPRWYIQHLTVEESVCVVKGRLSFDDMVTEINIALVFKDELDNCYIQKLSGRLSRATVSSPQKIEQLLFDLYKATHLVEFKNHPMKRLEDTEEK